jgi:hypothetical protein
MATSAASSPKDDRDAVSLWPLRTHRLIIFALYVIAWLAAYFTLSLPEARINVTALLSSGAIVATFGAAISGLGATWERDLINRVLENVGIFYDSIIESERWKRWGFLPRRSMRKLLTGETHEGVLVNPKIPLDVGTHTIRIDLPTVYADFFDLPVWRNWRQLVRYRNACHTCLSRRSRDQVNAQTQLVPMKEYMAYECLLDTWTSIVKFRVARYALHLGSALTIAAIVVVAFDIAAAR